jgi:trigger factor
MSLRARAHGLQSLNASLLKNPMQVEETGKLERRVSLVLPLSDIEKEVDARLKRLSRTVRMSGFRPGKVPMKIVAQQYGMQVQNEVMGEKVTSEFNKAVDEHRLRVAGTPKFAPKAQEGTGQGTVAFDVNFEVYPEVKVGKLEGIELERAVTEVAEAEVDKTVEILRNQRTHFHAKGEHGEHGSGDGSVTAAEGDRVTVDFTGKIDDVAFDGGSAEDFAFVLGEKRMLPEFEAAALGLKVGDSKTFDLTFPEDYQGKDVAGKTAQFTMTVKSIEWPHRPEIDADFAKSLGIADGDLDKMRMDIRANLEREVNKRLESRVKEKVMNALIETSELDLPKALVETDVQRLIEMTRNDMRERGMKVEDMPFPPDLFQAQAERRVRLGLIIAELVKTHQLEAKPDQVKSHVEEFAQSYENPAEVVRWYYADRSRLADVEALVLEQNVVKYVLDQANVKDVPIDFDELMGNPAR